MTARLAPGQVYEVRQVLAARYRGRDVVKRNTLSHALVVTEGVIEAPRTACKRVLAEALSDLDAGGEPTCGDCARWVRLANAERAL